MSNYLEKNKKIKRNLFKSITIGFTIPIIGVWFFIDHSIDKNVWSEFLLITKDKLIATGHITKAEGFTQELEENDGRKIREVSGYTYDYNFILPDGKEIKNASGAYGNMHLDKELSDVPFEIEVEYLVGNPEVNRIKGLFGNNESFLELFRRRILLGCIGLSVCFYLSYFYIKGGIKEYNESKLNSA